MTTNSACSRHPDHLTNRGCRGIIAVAPSPGWRAEWDTPDGRGDWTPVVGWGVLCNGDTVPLVVDQAGSVAKASENMHLVHDNSIDAICMGLTEIAQALR